MSDMDAMFPDYEPHFADTLCQGCQEAEAEPYESYCDECLGIISDAAGDLCSVPLALEENGKCRDCTKLRPLVFLGRCAECDRAKFPVASQYTGKAWTPPPPPRIPPFEEEATSHPRMLTNA